MKRWQYAAACFLPVALIALAFGALTLWGQDHRRTDCLRFVATHVTTDVAAWKRLVCHG